eukprot:55683_1
MIFLCWSTSLISQATSELFRTAVSDVEYPAATKKVRYPSFLLDYRHSFYIDDHHLFDLHQCFVGIHCALLHLSITFGLAHIRTYLFGISSHITSHITRVIGQVFVFAFPMLEHQYDASILVYLYLLGPYMAFVLPCKCAVILYSFGLFCAHLFSMAIPEFVRYGTHTSIGSFCVSFNRRVGGISEERLLSEKAIDSTWSDVHCMSFNVMYFVILISFVLCDLLFVFFCFIFFCFFFKCFLFNS